MVVRMAALTKDSVAKVNGNRNVPYLDRNDANRNLNLNWWSNRWNRNYRFLAVRYSLRSPASLGREFAYYLLAPPAKHPPYISEPFREMYIFLGVEGFDIPGELHEEFQQIYAGDAAVYECEFLPCRAIARKEAVLDGVEKYVVYLAPEREALRLGEVGEVLLPESIGVLKLEDNGNQLGLRNRRGG